MGFADFNGDGKADLWFVPPGGSQVMVRLSSGAAFGQPTQWATSSGNFIDKYFGFADFDGDGKADLWYLTSQSNPSVMVGLSTGSGFNSPAQWTTIAGGVSVSGYIGFNDFNGDGKADLWYFTFRSPNLMVGLSTGSNFNAASQWGYTNYVGTALRGFADLNGDGKIDFWYVDGTQLRACLSTGSSFSSPTSWPTGSYNLNWKGFADFNSDGKADFYYVTAGTSQIMVLLSTGYGFLQATEWGNNNNWDPNSPLMGFSDLNGDGMVDLWYVANGSKMMVRAHAPKFPDLLSSISNTIGGMVYIEYTTSSTDNIVNTQLPFPVQIVKLISVNDNNGIISDKSYGYDNGYYDITERDYRGFEHVIQLNSDLTTVENSYHQDNVFKGLMYESVIRDSYGNVFDNVHKSYQATYPYSGCVFPYLLQSDEYLYDGSLSYKHTASWFEYDAYGNVTRKYNYGDTAISGDERDERIEYAYDTSRWIVSLPSHTYVMDNEANLKAQSWFTYYSGTTNLYTKTNWLDNGVNPLTTYTYDSYGNLYTTTDPMGNVTTVSSHDPSYTYPTSVTLPPPMNFVSSKTYDYRYGKPLTETDVNNNTSTYQYDVFGRLLKIINPYDNTSTEGTQSIYYENFGMGVGSQRVATHSTEQSGTGNYLWRENYFDGFGRTIKTRSEGPDGKVIVTETDYDTMGRVSFSSLPYFEGLETARWVSYTYDPLGRVIRVTNPDGTYVTRSYLRGTTTSVDANFHKREEDRDAYGRLAEIREYTGASPNFALYATTRYRYGPLGTLDNVTDAAGNVTRIGYDSLSRKISMTDPDMGYWTYQYDANGNLTSQTDARNYTILFSYDALNRLTNKHYPTGPDVIYTYDELFSSNPKGRLTTVGDSSGTTKFFYDKLGRVTSTVKNVDGVDYTTDSTYDALGRTASVTYPDTAHEIVNYTYDTGGNLQDVVGYATYSNYNALGQAGLVTNGNGDNTVYRFDAWNNRIISIADNSVSQQLQNLTYAYDNVGNIRTITDLRDNTRTQNFLYDDLNRIAQAQSSAYGTLTYNIDAIGNMTFNSQVGSYTYLPAKPHAVVTAGGYSYSYDPNGNMMGRNGATLTHDYENRLSSLVTGGTTTTFVYDFSGGRVKKTSSSITTLYIGKLYECTSGVCTKHIFAGGNRIVTKKPSGTYYYHTDHLGSSSVVTDATGAKVEEIHYYPFGQTRLNSGSVNLHHKYTGQEEDAETGLYYYNARYYDPAIGRFISADTLVQNYSDPQTLNRYSYVRNNPLLYTDPSGHWFGIDDLVVSVIGAVVGATQAAIQGGNIYKGAAIGAAAAWVTYNTFGAATGVLADSIVGTGQAAYVANGGLFWTAQMGGGIAGGAAGGATASMMSGGDVGQGALTGGIVGGLGSFGIPNFAPFGESAAGSIGNRLFNTSLTGGAFGAAYSGVTGGDIWQGASKGAMAWAVGDTANMLIGNAIGFVGSGFKGPEYKNGVFVYKGNPWGHLTIGNAVWETQSGMSPVEFSHETDGHSFFQGKLLGPAYLPAHIADQLTVTHMFEYSKILLGGAPTYYDLYPSGERPWTWW